MIGLRYRLTVVNWKTHIQYIVFKGIEFVRTIYISLVIIARREVVKTLSHHSKHVYLYL